MILTTDTEQWYDNMNVCQSPSLFSIHLPWIKAVKYIFILYTIKCPSQKSSFAYCAPSSAIKFLLLDFYVCFPLSLHDSSTCEDTIWGIQSLEMWHHGTGWLVPDVMRGYKRSKSQCRLNEHSHNAGQQNTRCCRTSTTLLLSLKTTIPQSYNKMFNVHLVI